MSDLASDRQFVVDQWQYLFGRNPTQQELDSQTAVLQSGVSRADFTKEWEKANPEEAVTRIFREEVGRDPTPQELSDLARGLTLGRTTRTETRNWLATSYAPGVLHGAQPAGPTGPSAEQQSARAYLDDQLSSWGLGGLGDFAWGEIQNGSPSQRVIQDLRKTPEYAQRFPAMAARSAAGLPAISEAEYIGYESQAQQLLRAAGLPADFYDTPADFANFIGKNVSISELQTRVNDGFLEAMNAPAEFRQQLQEMYGVTAGQLTAFFLDPDRSLPLIQRDWSAAQASGAAVQAGYGALGLSEAERLASLGVSSQQAQQGFSQLVDSKQLFQNLPGEVGATISRAEQQNAVFANDAKARAKILKQGAERVSAGSGVQSFQLGQSGAAGLGQEQK